MNHGSNTPDKFTWLKEVYTEESGLSPPQKSVAAAIFNYMDPKLYCYPSIAKLARDTGYSERTVGDSIKMLRTLGYIKTVKKNQKLHFWGQKSKAKVGAQRKVGQLAHNSQAVQKEVRVPSLHAASYRNQVQVVDEPPRKIPPKEDQVNISRKYIKNIYENLDFDQSEQEEIESKPESLLIRSEDKFQQLTTRVSKVTGLAVAIVKPLIRIFLKNFGDNVVIAAIEHFESNAGMEVAPEELVSHMQNLVDI